MAVALEISTKKTLFRPIEIKIDGKLFRVKSITLGGLEALQALKKDAVAGSAAAIRKMLAASLDGPLDLLRDLTIDQVTQVIETAISKSVEPAGEEKNAPRPGRNKSR